MKKRGIPFEEFIAHITKEEFEAFYFEHSRKETVEHFNISESTFVKVRNWFQVKKPRSKILELMKRTNTERYGVDNPFRDRQRMVECYIQKDGSLEAHYAKCNQIKIDKALERGEIPFARTEEAKQKYQETCLKKYGTANVFSSEYGKNAMRQTKLERYGDAGYHNIEKMKQTNLDRYGVEYNFASEDDTMNGRGTYRKRLKEDPEFRQQVVDKRTQTCLERFGDSYYLDKVKSMLSVVSSHGNSQLNRAFETYLIDMGVEFSAEKIVGDFIYDFQVGEYLIELDPYATHNSTWGLYGKPKDPEYHRNKTLNALKFGYKCIHIFDWMNTNQIMYHILYGQLNIIDTGKPVKHIFDYKLMDLVNKESESTVIIYDDGFSLAM